MGGNRNSFFGESGADISKRIVRGWHEQTKRQSQSVGLFESGRASRLQPTGPRTVHDVATPGAIGCQVARLGLTRLTNVGPNSQLLKQPGLSCNSCCARAELARRRPPACRTARAAAEPRRARSAAASWRTSPTRRSSSPPFAPPRGPLSAPRAVRRNSSFDCVCPLLYAQVII